MSPQTGLDCPKENCPKVFNAEKECNSGHVPLLQVGLKEPGIKELAINVIPIASSVFW